MKRQLIILILIGILCLMGNYTFAQISEGGAPVSFSLDMDKDKIPEITMSPVDVRALLVEDERARTEDTQIPFRFGKAIDVDIDIKKTGMKKELPNGDKLWLLKIHCPDAYSVNLIYDSFRLGKGSKFFIYNEGRTMVLGAFTPEVSNNPTNEFATDLVQGNTVVLEYYEPKSSDDGIIHISKVIHGYVNTFGDGRGLDDSGKCNNDVLCQQWNNWINERRAVTMLLVDNNTAFCSGCLVNNTQQDFTPYILTANHCYFNGNGGQISNPATNIYRFFYWRPNCGSGNPSNWLSITGATLHAHNASTDFALLQLNTNPPASWNVYYAGWDRTTAISQSSTGIHHPSGDAMKISVDNQAVTSVSNYDAGNGPANCWRVFWDSGTTEGGSSGSPLFNSVSHRIIGQLYGGTAACNNMDGHDNYGRFDLSWTGGGANATRLSNWLAPGGGTPPQTLDGIYEPIISGPPGICTGYGAAYSVANAPQGFTWDASSNLSAPSTGNPVTVTALSSGAGWIAIKLGSIELTRYSVAASTGMGNPYISGPTEVNLYGHPYVPVTWSIEVTGSQAAVASYNWYGFGQYKNSYNYLDNTFSVNVSSGSYINCYVSDICGNTVPLWIEVTVEAKKSIAFPNPVSDILNITLKSEEDIKSQTTGKSAIYDIRLYDTQGFLKRKTTGNDGTVQLNVTNLSNGIYYLHVYYDDNEKPEVHKVIVDHQFVKK